MKSRARMALAGVLILALGWASPVLAAKHRKLTGACAQSSGRCVADCDQLHWCQVYACVGGKSTPVPFWRCFEPSGLCLAPHCRAMAPGIYRPSGA
ncbi:MAG: hypothetical protein WAM40_21420 [Xanthobacteraceae bacterium]